MLKKLLNSCLDAYRGSHRSVFDIDRRVQVGRGAIFDLSYVPPADGWLLLAGTARLCHIAPVLSGIQSTASETASGNSWCAAWIRVRKGSEYKMWAHASTDAVAVFYPDVGS